MTNTGRKPEHLLVTPFPDRLFTVTKRKGLRSLAIEASSLMYDNHEERHLTKLFPHSYRIGLAVRFASTGAVVAYQLRNTHMESYGAIEYWEYSPTTESVAAWSACRNTRVIVFND